MQWAAVIIHVDETILLLWSWFIGAWHMASAYEIPLLFLLLFGHPGFHGGFLFCYFTLVVDYYSIECWCNRSLRYFSLDIFFSVYINDVAYLACWSTACFKSRVLKMRSIV